MWEGRGSGWLTFCGARCSWAEWLHVAEPEQGQLHGIEEEDAGDGGECGDDYSGGGACKSENPLVPGIGFYVVWVLLI